MTTTDLYLTDRNGGQSLMNLDILDYLTEDDYIEIVISDIHRYRPEKIAQTYLGNKNYYFFIFWINEILSLDDLESGSVIKIPTLDFINRYFNEMKLVRNV